MYLISALYAEPSDRAAFDDHYLNVHRKIAERLPDIEHFTVSWPESGAPDGPYCVALMYWNDKDTAMAALTGPVGDEAMADMPNFAAAGATILMSQTEAVVPFPAKSSGADEDIWTALELHPQPAAPEAFDAHYREVGSPSLAKLPGLLSFTSNRPEPGPDGAPPPYRVVSALEWRTRDEMSAAAAEAGQNSTALACRSIRFR